MIFVNSNLPKMKNLLLIFVICLSASVYGQRFGYVDTDYVLNSLPQYADAQQRLEVQANNWANEIQSHTETLEAMLLEFQTEKILMTKEQIAERENEIAEKRTLIKELQEQRYGPNGDMLNVRRNLVKPIQDQIWNAVKTVAERRKYSFVFDKGSDLVMLYSDPTYDISEEVLRMVLPQGQEPVRGNRQNQKRANSENPMNQQKRDIKNIDNRLKIERTPQVERAVENKK